MQAKSTHTKQQILTPKMNNQQKIGRQILVYIFTVRMVNTTMLHPAYLRLFQNTHSTNSIVNNSF